MFLFSSKNEEEFMSIHKPQRIGRRKSDDFNCFFIQEDNGYVKAVDYDAPEGKQNFQGKLSDLTKWDLCDGDAVLLPKGTIKQLVGRELSFEDGPIEIEYDEYNRRNIYYE